MKIIPTKFPEIKLFEPKVFEDERGAFFEYFQKERYGIALDFVQDNFTYSKKNILRGLHYQLEKPQGKLLLVISGKIIDIAIDIRRGSPTFAESVCLELSKGNQVYVPPGFAHGFYVISDDAIVVYKCTDYYHPSSERGIIWNDPDLPFKDQFPHAIIAAKDAVYPRLKDISENNLPRYKA